MKVEEILKSKGRSVETIEVDASIAEAIGRLNGPPDRGTCRPRRGRAAADRRHDH